VFELDFFLFFSFLSLSLVLLLLYISFIIKKRSLNYEKLAPYECGFASFTDARGVFDVNFYVIGLLFLIFDVEIIIFIPLVLIPFNLYSLTVFFFLLFLLFIGFLLEWKKIRLFRS
jgi:NADH:ubiquinone oxidoreductase subunit 3 (subunit A)